MKARFQRSTVPIVGGLGLLWPELLVWCLFKWSVTLFCRDDILRNYGLEEFFWMVEGQGCFW
jgi:hypothetical protein